MSSKKHSISLSIPTPCQEEWNKMSPNEKGRHCESCNKTVIDFSLYSDRELIEFFTKTSGSVCGRLTKLQTEHQLVYSDPNRYSFLQKILYRTALASWLGLSFNAQGQNHGSPQTASTLQKDSTKKKALVYDTCAIVSGKIRDKKHSEPLPFANVIITYNSVQIGTAATDMNGEYKIPVSTEYLNKKLKIACVYEGYKDTFIEFTLTKHMPEKEIKLEESLTLITTGVIIIKEYTNNTPDKTTSRPGDNPYQPPRPHN